MTTRKHNEFLDIVSSDDEDNDRGYDSEAAEESKGRTVKRRRTQTRSNKLDGGSEAEEGKSEVEEIPDSEDEEESRPLKRKEGQSKRAVNNDGSEEDDNDDDEDEPTTNEFGDQFLDVTGDASHTVSKSSKATPKKPLDAAKLRKASLKKKKPGVIYFSSLPPYLKPFALKSLLEHRGFSPITKGRRSNKRKMYADGWICAETLNATIVGGKKGGWYHDDVWSIRYLHSFTWDNLTETINRERAERIAQRRIEDTRARKEDKVFLDGVEKGKVIDGIQRKKEGKNIDEKRQQAIHARRLFKQNEVKGTLEEDTRRAPRLCQEVARVLPAVPAPVLRPSFITYRRVRTLTSVSHLASDHPIPSSSSTGAVSVEEKETSVSKATSESSQHVPWYLQEETSVPAAEVTSREKLPELPENPPRILPDLTEYVFKDLGLNDLKFIDLRSLENPPPLGANTIMIIGTARSVKHLNVSADRLCRWLRSSYKLTPYADGLLGRNELKIKLRRKVRRARVASRTGTLVDEKDDGITTGWICVNAGVVEKGAVQEQQDGVFEGFGHLTRDTRVVVQMFTEEKRAELDLEKLWTGRIVRAQQAKEERHSDVNQNAHEQVRSPSSSSPTLSTSASSADYQSLHLSRSLGLPLEQRRQLYTERGGSLRPVTCREKIIQSLPKEEIRSALGDGLDDRTSTNFLQRLYGSLSNASKNEFALVQLELICMAISEGHPGYSRESLNNIFQQCCVDAAEFPDHLVSQIFDAVLTPRTTGPNNDGMVEEYFSSADKELAFCVIDQFLTRDQVNILNLESFIKLYHVASLPPAPGDYEKSPAERGSHVLRLIDQLNIPFDPVHTRTLMVSAFEKGDHEAFFKFWRRLPLKNSPRTYEDYKLLFRLHAGLGDGRLARDCLNTWVPMMEREEPQILLEKELAAYILVCLELAEPQREELVEGSGLFAELWRDCVKVVGN
ncbi:hypothetical protein BJX70DRAFT_390019 [Aspergillus crustosus]